MSGMVLDTSFHVEDDKVIVRRSQDVQSIIDWNKERNIEGHNRRSDMRLAGRIPFAIVELWLQESGLKLGSPEFSEYVKKKLMSGDFGKFIANGY